MTMEDTKESGEVEGPMRPIFLGNLHLTYKPEDVTEVFEKPFQPKEDETFESFPVDRIDQKRGYCFVFLKDCSTDDRERAEKFIEAISEKAIPGLSDGLRAEFAKGDGRVKRKEEERRKIIEPSETLFVVNFSEETTKRQDLEMLFEPFGKIVRVDMKRNYAFVQFEKTEQATAAKEATNGGKLDQAVLTVEYVAKRPRTERRGGGGDRDRRGPRRDDYRRRGPPPPRDRYGGPPPPYRDYDRPPRYRSRSRSRSPRRYSRSPPRRYDDDRYDRRGSPHRGDRGYR